MKQIRNHTKTALMKTGAVFCMILPQEIVFFEDS